MDYKEFKKINLNRYGWAKAAGFWYIKEDYPEAKANYLNRLKALERAKKRSDDITVANATENN